MEKHFFSDIVVPIEPDNVSIRRDWSKCIQCGMCKNVCSHLMHVSDQYTLQETNDEAVCINCGQCSVVCPTGAIHVVSEVDFVKNALADDEKIVTFSMSPAVRVSIGEAFGIESGTNLEKKIITLLKKMGVDYVFDTTFGADLTIMEEASELVDRIKNGGVLPQFTSCCPAWVKYVETFYPSMIDHLSTTKSPIGMQGAVIKLFFSKVKQIDPTRLVNVALVPCTAKKMEIRREELRSAGKELGIPTMRDMDYAISVRELVEWIKEMGIDFAQLPDSEFDDVLGKGSASGVIFGNSGGVMEAALRTAHYLLTGKNIDDQLLELSAIRGLGKRKKTSFVIGDTTINVAVVYTTRNADELLKDIISGKENNLHFVEVMACPGGCIGGAGQPKENVDDELRQKRIGGLYHDDKIMKVKFSHENPDIKRCYQEYFGKPLSKLSKKILHTTYRDRSGILGQQDKNSTISTEQDTVWVCPVCGYEHHGAQPPMQCPLCGIPGKEFRKK